MVAWSYDEYCNDILAIATRQFELWKLNTKLSKVRVRLRDMKPICEEQRGSNRLGGKLNLREKTITKK